MSTPKGRGAPVSASSTRFNFPAREADGDWLDDRGLIDGGAPPLVTQVSVLHPRTILSRNTSPDIQFDQSVNAYQGCEHGCIYCYARPTHEYLGFSAGLDFESRIMVKEQAPELLRAELSSRKWKPQVIALSGVTDCYQPVEASLELTKSCLEVCAEYRNPVGIITKGILVLRDLELLQRLHREAWTRVYFSIPFADDETARLVEPHAPASRKRFEAMARLSDAGIPTGISISPVIPGLNDEDIPELLRLAKAAGAGESMATLLRLSGPVEPVFLERIGRAFPDRVAKIVHRIREARAGAMTDGAFFSRHHGTGPYWTMIERLYDVARRKAGFELLDDTAVPATFRRPDSVQAALF